MLVVSVELGDEFDAHMHVSSLTGKQARLLRFLGRVDFGLYCSDAGVTLQIHQIVALLRQAKVPAPSGNCLSPAGEYNLRLGIMKVWGLVLTFCCNASILCIIHMALSDSMRD